MNVDIRHEEGQGISHGEIHTYIDVTVQISSVDADNENACDMTVNAQKVVQMRK